MKLLQEAEKPEWAESLQRLMGRRFKMMARMPRVGGQVRGWLKRRKEDQRQLHADLISMGLEVWSHDKGMVPEVPCLLPQ